MMETMIYIRTALPLDNAKTNAPHFIDSRSPVTRKSKYFYNNELT